MYAKDNAAENKSYRSDLSSEKFLVRDISNLRKLGKRHVIMTDEERAGAPAEKREKLSNRLLQLDGSSDERESQQATIGRGRVERLGGEVGQSNFQATENQWMLQNQGYTDQAMNHHPGQIRGKYSASESAFVHESFLENSPIIPQQHDLKLAHQKYRMEELMRIAPFMGSAAESNHLGFPIPGESSYVMDGQSHGANSSRASIAQSSHSFPPQSFNPFTHAQASYGGSGAPQPGHMLPTPAEHSQSLHGHYDHTSRHSGRGFPIDPGQGFPIELQLNVYPTQPNRNNFATGHLQNNAQLPSSTLRQELQTSMNRHDLQPGSLTRGQLSGGFPQEYTNNSHGYGYTAPSSQIQHSMAQQRPTMGFPFDSQSTSLAPGFADGEREVSSKSSFSAVRSRRGKSRKTSNGGSSIGRGTGEHAPRASVTALTGEFSPPGEFYAGARHDPKHRNVPSSLTNYGANTTGSGVIESLLRAPPRQHSLKQPSPSEPGRYLGTNQVYESGETRLLPSTVDQPTNSQSFSHRSSSHFARDGVESSANSRAQYCEELPSPTNHHQQMTNHVAPFLPHNSNQTISSSSLNSSQFPMNDVSGNLSERFYKPQPPPPYHPSPLTKRHPLPVDLGSSMVLSDLLKQQNLSHNSSSHGNSQMSGGRFRLNGPVPEDASPQDLLIRNSMIGSSAKPTTPHHQSLQASVGPQIQDGQPLSVG